MSRLENVPTPKYSFGQRVFSSQATTMHTTVPCRDCLGKKVWNVETPAGAKFVSPCQTCMEGWSIPSGVNKVIAPLPRVQELTIGSVRIDTAASDGHFVEYMCEETGIGSGSIHYESRLYLTENEAMEAAVVEAHRLVEHIERQNIESRAEKKKRGCRMPIVDCPKCKGVGKILQGAARE